MIFYHISVISSECSICSMLFSYSLCTVVTIYRSTLFDRVWWHSVMLNANSKVAWSWGSTCGALLCAVVHGNSENFIYIWRQLLLVWRMSARRGGNLGQLHPPWNLKMMTSYAVAVQNIPKFSLAPSALESNTLKFSLKRRRNRENFRSRLQRVEK